ncbi:MAG: hypothetical protein U0168_21790 [Nannocystaceae bacterium]
MIDDLDLRALDRRIAEALGAELLDDLHLGRGDAVAVDGDVEPVVGQSAAQGAVDAAA